MCYNLLYWLNNFLLHRLLEQVCHPNEKPQAKMKSTLRSMETHDQLDARRGLERQRHTQPRCSKTRTTTQKCNESECVKIVF